MSDIHAQYIYFFIGIKRTLFCWDVYVNALVRTCLYKNYNDIIALLMTILTSHVGDMAETQ